MTAVRHSSNHVHVTVADHRRVASFLFGSSVRWRLFTRSEYLDNAVASVSAQTRRTVHQQLQQLYNSDTNSTPARLWSWSAGVGFGSSGKAQRSRRQTPCTTTWECTTWGSTLLRTWECLPRRGILATKLHRVMHAFKTPSNHTNLHQTTSKLYSKHAHSSHDHTALLARPRLSDSGKIKLIATKLNLMDN